MNEWWLPKQRLLRVGKKRSTKLFTEPSEAQIEMQICDYLTLKGYFVQKIPTRGYFKISSKSENGQVVGRFQKDVSPYARTGMADLLVIKPGIAPFLLEIKGKSGRQSDEQIDFQTQWRASGGVYEVVRGIDCVDAALAKLSTACEQAVKNRDF